jgi:hypothetical protein
LFIVCVVSAACPAALAVPGSGPETPALEYVEVSKVKTGRINSYRITGVFSNPSNNTLSASLVSEVRQNGRIYDVLRTPDQDIYPLSRMLMINQFIPKGIDGHRITSYVEFNVAGSNETIQTNAVVKEMTSNIELGFVTTSLVMLGIAMALLIIYIRRRRKEWQDEEWLKG